MEITTGVCFLSNNNVVKLSEDVLDIKKCGIRDEFVFFDNVHIRPQNDLTIDIADHNTIVSLEHSTGEEVVSFSITNSVPNVLSDFKFDSLKSGEWYRLKFDETLAQTKNGTAHGKTSDSGDIIFNNVIIKDA